MKATWMAPFVLALATTPVLAVDSSSNVQQQSQTQGNVSPNAINPGQGKQPDGHTTGGENQKHTDDFGASRTANAEGATDVEADTNTDTNDNADNADNADNGTNTDGSASADGGASAERGSSVDSSASAESEMETDTDT